MRNLNEITINVESTAIALATLHPLFAPIHGNDYHTLIWNIKSSPKYLAYYHEVENVIKGKKDLFSDTNEALINSLDLLYDDILSDIDFDAYQNAPVMSLSRGTTRGIRERLDPTHFVYNLNGNKLTIQNRGLTPSYYGTVQSAMTWEESEFVVRSRSDYGGMDIFLPYDQVNLGPKCSYVFSSEGEHIFDLSRTKTAATIDFYMRLANSLLDIIGLDFGDDTVIHEIATTISNAMLSAGMNVAGSAVTGDDVSFRDWFGVAYSASVDYLKRDTNIFAKRGLLGQLRVYAAILNGALNIYGKIKGSINIGSRLAYALNAPERLKFCLCYYDGKIYDCVDASIFMISGNEQSGKPNKSLAEPLKVFVKTIDEDEFNQAPSPFHVIKFIIDKGGGSFNSGSNSFCNVKISSDNTAQINWILGEKGPQIVRAVIYDLITEEEVGRSVYFVASLIKDDDEDDEEDEEEYQEDYNENVNTYKNCPDNNHPHWIDLGLPEGTLWRCCNAGASAPEEYGGYYVFGQIASAPGLPESQELIRECSSEWTTLNGVSGRRFKGPNGGTIFLPAAGWGGRPEYITQVGYLGRYFTSDICVPLYEAQIGMAWCFYFSPYEADWLDWDAPNADLSVRPVIIKRRDKK